MTTPLLIVSDNPAGHTGLGIITRELATRIHENLSDVFRVGTAGIGGNHSARLPFPNWPIQQLQNNIPVDLPAIWQDFAGDEKGIGLFVLNHSWLQWLAMPERLPVGHHLREFLGVSGKPDTMTEEAWNRLTPQLQKILGNKGAGPFKKWLYCPVDGDLPDGTLGLESRAILAGMDRILGYTPFASKTIEKTLGLSAGTIPNLPHGCDTSVFFPRDRAEARRTFVNRLSEGKADFPLLDDTILIGAIATNSFRKDWGLCFEVCQELLNRGKNIFLWAHTNSLDVVGTQTFWSLMALVHQFAMKDRVILTTHHISTEDMPWFYSACDVTIGIGSGEGFGYPIVESIACGTPVIHGDYAGGAEFVPKEFLVPMSGYRLEGKWMIRRPCFAASDWADKVEFALTPEGKSLAKLPEYIDWDNAWPAWSRWLTDGLAK